MRQMVLVGLPQAQNCTTLASAWRHPESRTDFTTAAYYQKIGQVLEEGKFQLGFFDDRLAMPDIYDNKNPPARWWRTGYASKMDPVATLLAMGFGTRCLGIGRRRQPPITNRSMWRAGSRLWTTCWAAVPPGTW